MEEAGAGELLLHNIDREGMYSGYDVELIRSVAEAVGVPVVAVGGARNVDDLAAAVHEGHASAVMAGSMFVFHGPHRAVLINFPEQTILEQKVFPAAGS
jgi:cyclase